MTGTRTRSVLSAMGGYAMAVVLVAAAVALSLVLGRILPFSFLLISVTVCAWFRGTAVGLFAVAVALVATNMVLGTPPHVFGVSVEYIPRLLTFALTAFLLLWVIAARHRAERALREAHDELDQRVRDRTASLVQTNERLLAEMDERKRSDQRLAAAGARFARAKRRAHARVLEARFDAVLEERTRLAREIHDTLLQGFTGVSFQLMATMRRLTGPPENLAALGEVLVLAQKTLADARQAVWDMRPPALGGDDFAAALGAAMDDAVAGTALTLRYRVNGAARALEPSVETVVFRVAQEALVNVVKHANAQSVRAVISYRRRTVRLIIADDGCGFIVERDAQTYAGHWGLLGMRERANQLRGKVQVSSAPGEGTRIILRLPTWSGASRDAESPERTRA